MKSRLYYVLYFLYVIVVAFVLYLNGVFTGEKISVVNLSINIGFLIVIGIVFIISSVSFGRLNRIIYDLEDAAIRLQKEYKESGGKNLWGNYKLTLLQPGRLEAINFYKPININDENKFLIVYGDVSNRDISRIDIEVSNHSIPINISSKIFAECIPTDQYFDTATYFTYKCYDHYGNLIKDL